ncbi:MAG: SpoIID/LytB domain-containing protein [bacterium]
MYRRGAENDSCRGRVDVIPLEEYVRGVVPHEWIPSWHLESLKAGAVAARTYAANWVLNGGKYDCADVDDTARSQVYADDRNARADDAVRATACEVVTRDGAMINAEYSAENSDPTEFGVSEPLCSGRARNGHGRGMCQWGTQRWADQRGQTYRWMVEHYYPGATVGNGCADPRPDLQLRQRLSRVDAEPCIDPASTYDCADFVRQGWSVDIFDVYAGRRFELAIELTNSGGAATPAGTTLKMALPASFSAVAAQVDGRDAGAALGGPSATIEVSVPAIQPGATARVAFTLRGEGSSLAAGAPVPVRTWIARMGAFYEKPDWGGAARNNDGQTFNGGDLKVLAEFDVFSPDVWTFDASDPTLVEGFEGVDRAALRAPGGVLQVPAGGAVSPFTHIDADRLTRVQAVGLAGRLYWRHAGEGFDAQRSVRVDGEADLAGLPGWSGEIQQVRFEPDAAGGLDRLAFAVAAGPGPAPDPDAGPPPPPPDAAVPTDPPPPPPARRDAGEEPHDPLPDLDDAGTGATPVPPLPPGARGVRGETTSGCQASPVQRGGAFFGLLVLALPLVRRRRRG